MTKAYRFAPAGITNTMNLLNVAFAAIFGWILFNETLILVQSLRLVLLVSGVALVTCGACKAEV